MENHKSKAKFIKLFCLIALMTTLLAMGIVVGVTYSAFQSSANVTGTITFAINGHKGTLAIANANIDEYDVTGVSTTEFIFSPNSGYALVPSITLEAFNSSNESLGSTTLTPSGANSTAESSGHSYTYTSQGVGTLQISNVSVMAIQNMSYLKVSGSASAGNYTITFNDQSATTATVVPTTTATFGQNPPRITTLPTKTGYSFGGFYTLSDGKGEMYYTATGASVRLWDIASNTTLYAYWIQKTQTSYAVYLDNQGATTPGTVVVIATNGSAMPNITIPTKTSYSFAGYWTGTNGSGTKYYNTDGTSARTCDLTSNTTLYACWRYTVIYHTNAIGIPHLIDSSISDANEVYEVQSDSLLTKDQMEGYIQSLLTQTVNSIQIGSLYTFDGWYESYNFSGNAVTTITGNTTLYAKWTIEGDTTNSETKAYKFVNNWATFDTSTGAISKNYSSPPTGNLVIPATIGGTAVTSMGYSAFADCSGLTSVTIPGSVTSIGSEAFYCCGGLTTVTIGDGVTSMDYGAFSECDKLIRVAIGSGVTSLDDYQFNGCKILEIINFSSLNIVKGSWAYDEFARNAIVVKNSGYFELELIDGVYYVGTIAGGCSGDSTNLVLKNTCTAIADGAFSGKSSITSITIPNSVTSIGDYAFDSCSGLTSITIPNSVTSIGDYAFTRCSGLTSITIGSGVTSIGDYAFDNCSGLTSITIPNSLTSMGRGMFNICSGLTSIEIPDSVTSIGDYAFSSCSGLTSIEIPDSVTSIGDSAFTQCSGLTSITIGSNVTSIGDYAFSKCTNLTSITIPNSVTSIGSSAFNDCTGLEYTEGDFKYIKANNNNYFALLKCTDASITSVTINSNTRYVLPQAFISCTKLTTLSVASGNTKLESRNNGIIDKSSNTLIVGCKNTTIPNSVTNIGQYAFYGCSGLTSIEIPDSVTSIGQYAFSGCSGLTSITIGSGVTSIGNNAFSGCSGLTSITIPNSVTSIGNNAFYGCSGLTSVTIGSGVESIGDSAFSNCSGLTSVTIGSGVTSIGGYAFSSCSGLTSITIPNSVTSIGNNAFYKCYSLVEVINLSSLSISKGDTSNGGVAQYAKVVKDSGPSEITKTNGVYYYGNIAVGCDRDVTNVVLKDTCTEINGYAFYYYTGLTSITIPDSVTSIGSSAFNGCSGLTSITIGSGVTSIGSNVFQGCSGLTSIEIPDSVTEIGGYAFQNCSGLTSITIPDSVTSIGSRAFQNCSGLTSVTIGSGVTSIGGNAFQSCSSLATVIIDSSYAYNQATSTSKCGYLLTKSTTSGFVAKVLKSIDDGSNTYLNNTTNFTKTESGDYYVYTRK